MIPIMVVGLVLVAIPGWLLAMAWSDGEAKAQLSIVGNLMLICFVICPMVLCFGGVYAVVLVVGYGVHKTHHFTQRTLQSAEQKTRQLADKTQEMAEIMNQKSLGVGDRLSFMEPTPDEPESEPKQLEGGGEDGKRD